LAGVDALHLEVAKRLLANVEADGPDQCDSPMKVPVTSYLDPVRWEREVRQIFLKVPLLVALSCDVPEPGDFTTAEICGRPIVVMRGDDGQARVFLNACRHRGARVVAERCGSARRFTCPYHSWSYDRQGALVGVPGRETFGEIDVTGLIELPSAERVGVVLAALSPDGEFDADEWLGPMAPVLASLRLTELHLYPVVTELEGPNWKIAADGYVDGYHIGYLHRASIGAKAVTNRNTYDRFGPHQRIGFATKQTHQLPDIPASELKLPEVMSLVHFVFPNVSMSGGHGDELMLSRLIPGPTPDRSRTLQYQYFRQKIEGEDMINRAEARRELYERVVRDEDYATGFGITAALAGLGDQHFRFGRNEPGNQHLHQCIDALVAEAVG
jgi:phenylpropionate dioxygenase-like ring-hydroxylating dioxygenase large terminal subunit